MRNNTSLKTGSVPAHDLTSRDVLDHQWSHGVRLAPRPVTSGDCARDELLTLLSDIVADYLSRPMCQGETVMPLVTLRTWLRWRLHRDVNGDLSTGHKYELVQDALDIVTWAIRQPHSGLVIVRVKKQRQRAAA
jgi:hypothetical protein